MARQDQSGREEWRVVSGSIILLQLHELSFIRVLYCLFSQQKQYRFIFDLMLLFLDSFSAYSNYACVCAAIVAVVRYAYILTRDQY